MNVLQQIEKRAYLATDAQIAELARLNYDSTAGLSGSQGTYLRVLLAGMLEHLGFKPRLRASKGTPPAVDKDSALDALEAVHARYYGIVLEAITTPEVQDKPTLKKADKSRRALERNRRSNFARTSKSLLRAYVAGGGNVCALIVPAVTKAYLREEISKRKPKPAKEERIGRVVNSVMQRIEALQEADKDIAAQVSQRLILQLSQIEGCEKFTKSPKRSMEESIPLRMNEGIFIPIPPNVDGQRLQ